MLKQKSTVDAWTAARRARRPFTVSGTPSLSASGLAFRPHPEPPAGTQRARALTCAPRPSGPGPSGPSRKSGPTGASGAVASIIRDFTEKRQGGSRLYISHCSNPAVAEQIRAQVLKIPSPPEVKIMETRGLDSFYAENEGVIVSYDGVLQKHNLISPILDRI